MVQSRVGVFSKLKNKVQDKSFAKNLFVFLCLLIPTLCFLLFFVYIHIDSFLLAFRTDADLSIFDNPKEVFNDFTFDTLKRVFSSFFSKNGVLGKALINTLIYFASGLLLSFPVSLLMSYFIYKKIRGFKFFRVITYIPAIITSTALIALFIQTINTGGPLHRIFYVNHNNSSQGFVPLIASENPYIVTLILVFYGFSFGFGGNIVVFCGAMNSIDKQILEAGEIDGCNWFREFISIIIPTIWPTISTVLILSCAGLFAASGPLLAFYPSLQVDINGVTTLSFELYRYVAGNLEVPKDLCYSSAIGLVMTIITFPIVLIIRRLLSGDDR